MRIKMFFFITLAVTVLVLGFTENETQNTGGPVPEGNLEVLEFQQRTISDSVNYLWAYRPVDVDADGLADLLFVDSNHSGGQLGFFKGTKQLGHWTKRLIDEEGSTLRRFAMGDIEASDMDGDGDLDIVAAYHEGEWESPKTPSQVYWYENPTWEKHYIGVVPNFIKDVEIEDINADGQVEIVLLTFEEHTLTIFKKIGPDGWSMAQQYKDFGNLHEGMDTGDVDGDGYPDIVSCGYVFYSPGKSLEMPWKIENIDEKWNDQTGDWSRNATKVFIKDLEGDGKSEIFIAHSERKGYPLSYYKREGSSWTEHIIINDIPACHTLQVFDFNGDGLYDILAGSNPKRAEDLGVPGQPMQIFLGSKGYQKWVCIKISGQGVYNGRAMDFDLDGDIDVFRYRTHDATTVELFENMHID